MFAAVNQNGWSSSVNSNDNRRLDTPDAEVRIPMISGLGGSESKARVSVPFALP